MDQSKRTASRLCLLVVLLLFPFSASTIASEGRQIDPSPNISLSSTSTVAPGTVLTITSTSLISGSSYRIWAKHSISDSEFVIDSQKEAVEEKVTSYWSIPESIETGSYQICIDYEDQNEREFWTSDCSSVSITIFEILIEVDEEVPAPGHEVKGTVSFVHLKDGKPTSPATANLDVQYYIAADGPCCEVKTISKKLEPFENTQFAFVVPSNVEPSFGVTIIIWGNTSTGQSTMASKSVFPGTNSLTVTMPSLGEAVRIDSPFNFQAYARRVGPQYSWSPEVGLDVDVFVNQSEKTHQVEMRIPSNSIGQVSSILDFSSITTLEVGSAILSLRWKDPIEKNTIYTEHPIFLTGYTATSGNAGGIEITVTDDGTEVSPGEKTTIVVEAVDVAGNPIKDTWVHWSLKRIRSISSVIPGFSTSNTAWNSGKTTDSGVISIDVSVPDDFNAALENLQLQVMAWNHSGARDSLSEYIDIKKPDIDVEVEPKRWTQGDRLDIDLSFEGMTGSVTIWWEITELDLRGIENIASAGGTFVVQLPKYLPTTISDSMNDLQITMVAVDENGIVEIENKRIYKLQGYVVKATTVSQPVVAGDTLEIDIELIALGDTELPDEKVGWDAYIISRSDTAVGGELSTTSGRISLPIPADMPTGIHLVEVGLGMDEALVMIEVRSADDASGFAGFASSANDILAPATPWISILAVIIGSLALLLGLLRKGGKDGGDTVFTPTPPPMPLPTPTPTQQSYAPPPIPQQAALGTNTYGEKNW